MSKWIYGLRDIWIYRLPILLVCSLPDGPARPVGPGLPISPLEPGFPSKPRHMISKIKEQP